MNVMMFKKVLAVGMAVFWVLFAYSFVGHAHQEKIESTSSISTR